MIIKKIVEYVGKNKETGVTFEDIALNAFFESTSPENFKLTEEDIKLTGLFREENGLYFPLEIHTQEERALQIILDRIKEVKEESDEVQAEMEEMEKIEEDLDSDEYKELEIRDISLNGAIGELFYLKRMIENSSSEEIAADLVISSSPGDDIKCVTKGEAETNE